MGDRTFFGGGAGDGGGEGPGDTGFFDVQTANAVIPANNGVGFPDLSQPFTFDPEGWLADASIEYVSAWQGDTWPVDTWLNLPGGVYLMTLRLNYTLTDGNPTTGVLTGDFGPIDNRLDSIGESFDPWMFNFGAPDLVRVSAFEAVALDVGGGGPNHKLGTLFYRVVAEDAPVAHGFLIRNLWDVDVTAGLSVALMRVTTAG